MENEVERALRAVELTSTAGQLMLDHSASG